MKTYKDVFTEEDSSFTEFTLEFLKNKLSKKEVFLNENLAILTMIQYFLVYCDRLSIENRKWLRDVISNFFSDENYLLRETQELSFDEGFYSDLLFKCYSVFLFSGIRLFLTNGRPIFDVVEKRRLYKKEFNKRIISYSVLFDFFVVHPYQAILETYKEIQNSGGKGVFPLERTLEILVREIILETDIYLKSVIIRGIINILTFNKQVFKIFDIDSQELIGLLFIQLHNQNIKCKQNDEIENTFLEMRRFLGYSLNYSSSEGSIVFNSFLKVAEVFLLIRTKCQMLDRSVIDIDIYDEDFWVRFFKNTIQLTVNQSTIEGNGKHTISILTIEIQFSENILGRMKIYEELYINFKRQLKTIIKTDSN